MGYHMDDFFDEYLKDVTNVEDFIKVFNQEHDYSREVRKEQLIYNLIVGLGCGDFYKGLVLVLHSAYGPEAHNVFMIVNQDFNQRIILGNVPEGCAIKLKHIDDERE